MANIIMRPSQPFETENQPYFSHIWFFKRWNAIIQRFISKENVPFGTKQMIKMKSHLRREVLTLPFPPMCRGREGQTLCAAPRCMHQRRRLRKTKMPVWLPRSLNDSSVCRVASSCFLLFSGRRDEFTQPSLASLIISCNVSFFMMLASFE